VSMPVRAVWTEEERTELRKIVNTALIVQEVVADLTEQATSLPNVKNALPAIASLNGLTHTLYAAFSHITHPENDAAERAAAAYRQLDNISEHRSPAADRLRALGKNALADRLTVLPVDTFDRTRPYFDPRPTSFPNVVGPHGDWKNSVFTIEHTTQYVNQTQFDLVRMWQNTNGNNANMLLALRSSARATQKFFRTWAISSDTALLDDEATARADAAKSSTGLRPPVFFKTLLSLEYCFGNGDTVFSGRRGKLGAAVDLRRMGTQAVEYMQSLPPNELVQMFVSGTGGNFGAGGSTTWAWHMLTDLFDHWRAMDIWGGYVMIFFRPPLAPRTVISE
jgi:hypothetical protein